jgi:hypothetical protein
LNAALIQGKLSCGEAVFNKHSCLSEGLHFGICFCEHVPPRGKVLFKSKFAKPQGGTQAPQSKDSTAKRN